MTLNYVVICFNRGFYFQLEHNNYCRRRIQTKRLPTTTTFLSVYACPFLKSQLWTTSPLNSDIPGKSGMCPSEYRPEQIITASKTSSSGSHPDVWLFTRHLPAIMTKFINVHAENNHSAFPRQKRSQLFGHFFLFFFFFFFGGGGGRSLM